MNAEIRGKGTKMGVHKVIRKSSACGKSKYLPVALIIVTCVLSVLARRQRDADSAFMVDSLRQVDSVHRVDSLRAVNQSMIDEFAAAEEALKAEKARREQERLEQERLASQLQQEAVERATANENAVDGRTIVIDPKSAVGIATDSLDREIAAVRARLYHTAKEYKKLETLNADDQVAYLRFLMKNKLRDTTEVVSAFEYLYQVQKMEYEKLTILRDALQGNDRSFVQAHLRTVQNQMGRLGVMILSFSNQTRSSKGN
jgi:hypothetical protein